MIKHIQHEMGLMTVKKHISILRQLMSRDEFQFHDGGQREARQFFSPIHFVPSSSLENIQRSCNGNYLRRRKKSSFSFVTENKKYKGTMRC